MPESKPTLFQYRFANVVYDEANAELRVSGLPVEVQQKPLQLLSLLLSTPGEVLTKDALYRAVWRDRITVENVLANAVSKLRSALGEDNGQLIATVPRQGYRFTSTVERIAVGRRLSSQLEFQAGTPAPDRPNFVLTTLLGSSEGSETWLARHIKTGEARVYKFAVDGQRLADLKREVTLYRVLRESLGQRPDIARIIDWNFARAPFFLECEYGGDSLANWAAQAEHDVTPLQAMSQAERLALFLQIVDAVAAAHSVGVLHKDLKPSNVLVRGQSGAWQLQLTDFGSGRLLDTERIEALRITQLGMTLAAGSDSGSGTPFYLAPELGIGQAPTVRSDVYALGVMLYQLLAGDLRKWMASGWERDIADPLLREDIARATDIEPERRMQSAAELASELRALDARHRRRDDLALAQERGAEAQLVIERNRVRRPWVVAAMLALLVGVGAGLWLYLAERRTAQALAQQFETAHSFDRLMREGLIAAANPALSGRADITVADALKIAAGQIDSKFAGSSPTVRAGLHQAMQNALSELSRTQDAVVEGQRALRDFARADSRDVAAMQEVRLRLAVDLVQLSRLHDAAVVTAQIEHDAQPLLQQPAAFRARLLFVKAWLTGGELALAESARQLQAAYVLIADKPETEAPWREKIIFALADNLSLLGRFSEAERLFRKLLDEQSKAHGVNSARAMITLVGLGNTIGQQAGRELEARALLLRAAQGLQQTLGQQHRMTLSARDALASIELRQGEFAVAITEWTAVYQGFSALLGPNSSYALTVQTNLAMAHHYAGHEAQAELLLRSALQRSRTILKEDAPQVQQIRYALADCLLDQSGAAEAAALLDGLDPLALNLAQQERDWPALLAFQHGRVALAQGESHAALTMFERAAAELAPPAAHARVTLALVQRFVDKAREQ